MEGKGIWRRLTKYSNDLIRNKAVNILRKLDSENGLDGDELALISSFCLIERVENKQLKKYEDLEEQGKLLKLPCAVGDAVYEICEGFIEPCTVETIFLADYKDKAGNPSYMMEIYYDREDCPWVSTEIYFTDIGKTVFLTREEAEAALKELESGKGE